MGYVKMDMCVQCVFAEITADIGKWKKDSYYADHHVAYGWGQGEREEKNVVKM